MAYATVTDVSTRLGRAISDPLEISQVNAWIADIEDKIVSAIPTLDDAILAGAVTTTTVKRVVCQSVIRKIKNPDGKKDERVDDYSYGLNPEAARGELFLTDEEWADITPTTSRGAFTAIDPIRQAQPEGTWTGVDTWEPL